MGRVLLLINVLILITLIKQSNSACNSSYPYSFNSVCFQQCPWNNTVVTYLDTSTNTCVQNCTGTKYAFDANKTCLSVCPSTPVLTFYDKQYNRCVMNCTNNPVTFADLNSRICVSSCAAPTYADQILGICVSNCSVNTYFMAYNTSDRRCVKVCYPSFYANLSRVCVAATSCPSSNVTYYGDDSTGLCVKTCPVAKGTFADDQTKKCVYYCPLGTFAEPISRKCVSQCPVVPNYFGSNITRNCILVCNDGQFADPKTRQCTEICPTGLFGDYSTRTCVTICPRNQSTFADSITNLCVPICPADYYADGVTQKCVLAINCGKNTYGDPVTQVCVEAKNCSKGLYADIGTGKCVLRCTTWGNPLTNFCQSTCPWNPPGQLYYKDASSRQCVKACPIEPRTFGDEVTRSCVQTCPTDYYSNPLTMLCVRACNQSFYANVLTRQCLAQCTRNASTILFYSKIDLACVTDCPINYYADNVTLNCQQVCTNFTYGYYPTRMCLPDCPDGWFGSNYTRTCVQSCPIVTNQYADPSTNLCVNQCPQTPDYYGQNINDGNMTCVQACIIAGFFADPLTRLCVYNCNTTLGYYGDPSDGRCYPRCPTGFGNPLNSQCVSQCPKTPKIFFGDSMTKTCVLSCPPETYGDPINNLCVKALSCPSGHFGDDITGRCLAVCNRLLKLFADPIVKKCVPACTFPYFADPNRQACVLNCTNNFYKDNSTLTCVQSCPSMPDLYGDPNSLYCEANCTNQWFSYSQGTRRVCVQMCPTNPPMLADLQSYTCVSKCANETYSFMNNSFRGCMDYCPPQVYSANLQVNLYADNTTWSCVVVCPYGYYAFTHPTNDKIRKCVKMCPMVGTTYYYAQDWTRTCVTACPLLYKFSYADSINFRCTTVCSRSQYKDNSTATCVKRCPDSTFANNQTWNCSKWCNQGYFAQKQNNTCVKVCPPYQYGYKKVCLTECPNNTLQYKQNTTWLCVSKCPSYPDYYADNNSVECVLKCPVDWFADSFTRTCVLPINCTEPTVADPVSGRCVIQCPMDPVHYLTIDLNLCVQKCLNGTFAFNQTNLCVDQCPTPYFGANLTNNTICVQYCPTLQYKWVNNTTRRCTDYCPDGLYRDNLTMSCVKVCPDYSYANKSNNLCVLSCFPLYADDYTKSCVEICPNTTTASNNSFRCQQFCHFGTYMLDKICYKTCPNGLFANNLTRACISNCSLIPLTYADPLNNKCIFNCTDTQFAYLQNRTCATTCPLGNYKQLTFKLCLKQCLQDYYADNDTQSCVLSCNASRYPFADPTFRTCVALCPQNPDLFGYNNKCITQCPSGLYAQNITRTCMSICPFKNATYLNESWADDLTRRCLAKCSALSYSFTNTTHNVCLNTCPTGFYASISKKSCLDQCPLGSYAHIPSKTCVDQCPPGLWADLIGRICKSDCKFNISLYADDSSGACVDKCPTYPDLYADTVAQKCVLTCPPNTYAYNITRKCVSDCPQPYFADTSKLQCVLKCLIPQITFADSYNRKCASGCQDRIINGKTVIYYEDNSTLRCVQQCPQYPAKLYGVNNTHICSQSCPSGTYGDNDTRVCLNTCVFETPKFTWKDKLNNFCVTFCPYGYFADNFTNSCETTCTSGTFADPSTRRCVINCPINPASYSIILSNVGVCVYNCPQGTYSSEVTISCVQTCPTSPSMYYTYPPTNACVKQCIFPYYADTNTRACTENCKVGFYGNKTLKTCQPCRIQCVTCIGYLVCTSCVEGFYLSSRSCVINCPSYPVLYFAHKQAGVCYQMCPSPFYGEASTGLCQLTCPSFTYPHTYTRKCTSCPPGCVLCNQLGCSSCMSGYTFLPSALMCNQNCNQTARYYFKDFCYFTCPDGSYLTYDLVHCAACSWPCATCMGVAGNCTSCIESYYYLGQCLAACPNNFYVDERYNCIACSSNPQKCALPPLSYTFFPFTANYLLQVYIIFNRAVSMSAEEVQKTVQIKSNGVAVPSSKYEVSYYNTTTFLAVFDKSMSLNELALSFSFSPGSISDQFGNILTTVTVNQTIVVSTGLTPSIAEASVSLQSVISYVSYFLLALIAILLIKNNYAALICLQFLQLLHLHSFLYWDTLPFLEFTFLDNIRYFNLAFLPSFFTPLNITNDYYSQFTQDVSYLGNSPILLIFVLVIAFYLLTSILSSKRMIKNKHIRKTFKKIRKYRVKYGLLHDALWITYPYAMIISMLQFQIGGFGSTQQTMNIALAILTFIIANAAVLYITFLSHKYKKEPQKIPRKFTFLNYDPSNMTIEVPLRYLRKLLFVVSFMFPSFQSQIVSLLAINIAFIFYYLCHHPAKSSVTNYVCLFLELLMIILESIFYAYNRLLSKTTESQIGFSLGMLTIQGVAIVTIIVWLVYRLVFMIRETDSWKHIYAKITQNTDPEYLREQQRKRDLEFDFEGLDARSQDEQTNHAFEKISSKNNLLDEKDNIFDRQERNSEPRDLQKDININQDKKKRSRPGSMESSQKIMTVSNSSGFFQPRKSAHNYRKRKHLDIQYKELNGSVQQVIVDKAQQEKEKINKETKGGQDRVLWQDIELEENEI